MINRQVVENIVAEVLEKLEQERARKRMLLVVNAQDENFLKQLEKRWKPVIISSPTDIPEKCEDAVFLYVSQDLLAKSVLGITDTDESQLFSYLMMTGKRIAFIPSDRLGWLLAGEMKKGVNQHYIGLLLAYKKRLETFGVQFLSISELLAAGSNDDDMNLFQNKLLTAKDVIHSTSNKISVAKTTIITPLARDSARELGKTISVIE